MEWVPMPPFGLILSKNVPTGVRMPLECLPDQKTKFFRFFPGFFPPQGPPQGPPRAPGGAERVQKLAGNLGLTAANPPANLYSR